MRMFLILDLPLIRKIISIFLALVQSKFEYFSLKMYKISEQPQKCCQSPILAIVMKILKWQRLLIDKCPHLGTYPDKSPQATIRMQKPQHGGKFLVQIPIDAQGHIKEFVGTELHELFGCPRTTARGGFPIV